MIIKGKVLKLLPDNLAEIALADSFTCAGCQGCLAAAGGCEIKTVTVINSFRRRVGADVELEVPAGYYYKAFFFVFALPLFSLLATLVILQALAIDPVISLLAAFLVFICSYYFAKKYDQKIKEQTVYVMIK